MEKTYIKIEEFLNWEWYGDNQTTRLYLHLLIKANPETERRGGEEIKRGQWAMMSSLEKLAKTLDMSIQSLRTALEKLKSTEDIRIKTTKKYRLIEVVKYEKFRVNCDIKDINERQHESNKRISGGGVGIQDCGSEEQHKNKKRATRKQHESNKRISGGGAGIQNDINERQHESNTRSKMVGKKWAAFEEILYNNNIIINNILYNSTLINHTLPNQTGEKSIVRYAHNTKKVEKSIQPIAGLSSASGKEKNGGGKKEKGEAEYEEALAGFVEMRKLIKKPLTARGKKIMIGRLGRFANTWEEKAAVLDQSVMNCWQGVFPLSEQGGRQGGKPKSKQESDQEAFERLCWGKK